MPLLAEFDLQPPVSDAHSMVSHIKVSYTGFIPLGLGYLKSLLKSMTSMNAFESRGFKQTATLIAAGGDAVFASKLLVNTRLL